MPYLVRSLFIGLAIIAFFGWHNLSEAAEFQQPEAIAPKVEPASGEAAEAMAGIKIPDGWEIELFAAEPEVANVVAMDIDPSGRLYVCETFRQNRGVTDNRGHDQKWLHADLSAQTVQDRIDYHKALLGDAAVTYAQHDDRIRRIADTDGDGKADESIIIADGFNRIEEGTAAGILVRPDAVYLTNIPKLYKLVDADGDGRVDEKVVMSDGYGVRVAFRGHDLHGLIRHVDGRLYFSIGDRGYHITTEDGRVLADPASGAVFRCELDGSNLEVFATGLRNPQELAFNDEGELFSVDNNSDSGDQARIVRIIRGSDAGWRMHYQYLPDRGPFNREKIWEPQHPEQPAFIVPPIANFTDGPSGLAFYPGTGFGDSLKNKFFICDFRGGPANSGIRSFELNRVGAFHELVSDDQPVWMVLATDALFGPDGAMYVSDWVDGWEGLGKGRVYRLSDPAHRDSDLVREVQSVLTSDWSTIDADQLAKWMGHVDRRVRLESQWELAKRGDYQTLIDVLSSAQPGTELDRERSLQRLHATWGLGEICRQGSLAEGNQVLAGLASAPAAPVDRPGVTTIQTAAIKMITEAITATGGEMPGDLRAALESHAASENARLATAALMALAAGGASDKPHIALNAADRFRVRNQMVDPIVRHAASMYLAASTDPKLLDEVAKHPKPRVRRLGVVAMRRLGDPRITDYLKDSDPLVVAEAVRAIHDTDISVAVDTAAAKLLELADRIDDESVRRLVNLNLRIGDPSSAIRLADFAAGADQKPTLRLEALNSLREWPKPDVIDGVTHEFRPLEPRQVSIARDALAPHVDALIIDLPAIRKRSIEVAADLGIQKIAGSLVDIVINSDASGSERASALRSLAKLKPGDALKLAKEIKGRPASELTLATLDVMAELDSEGSIDAFVSATSSRDTAIRQKAWDVLSNSSDQRATETIASGVQQYLRGELASDVELNVIEAADGRIEDELAKQLDDHQAKLANDNPLGKYMVSLDGGDPDAGSDLFFGRTELSCVRCHKVNRTGGQVGPVLTTIGKQHDRRYLLEAIALPGAAIAKGY
ncbi:MAG: PVC-type heme-binding CxxCH protein, partial [Planctomycetota bacterium]